MNREELHGLIGKFVSMTLTDGSVLEGELMWADSSVAVLAVRGDKVRVCPVADIARCEAVRRTFLTIGNKARYYTALDDAIGYKSKNMDEIDWNKAALCYETAARECGFDDSLLDNYLETVVSNLLNTHKKNSLTDEEFIEEKLDMYRRLKTVLERYDLGGLSDFGVKKLLKNVDTLRLQSFAGRLVEEGLRRSSPWYEHLNDEMNLIGIGFDLFVLSHGANAFLGEKKHRRSLLLLQELYEKYDSKLKKDPENNKLGKAVSFISEVIGKIRDMSKYDDESCGEESEILAYRCFKHILFAAMHLKNISGVTFGCRIQQKSVADNHKKLNRAIKLNILLFRYLDPFLDHFPEKVRERERKRAPWQLRLELLDLYARKFYLRSNEKGIDSESKRLEYLDNFKAIGLLDDIDYSTCDNDGKLVSFLEYLHQLKMDDEVRRIGELAKDSPRLNRLTRLYIYYKLAEYYYYKSENTLEAWKYLSLVNGLHLTESEEYDCRRFYPGVLEGIDTLSVAINAKGDVLRTHYNELLGRIVSELEDYGAHDLDKRSELEARFVGALDDLAPLDLTSLLDSAMVESMVTLLEEFRHESETSLLGKLEKVVAGNPEMLKRIAAVPQTRTLKLIGRREALEVDYRQRFQNALDIYTEKKSVENPQIPADYFRTLESLRHFDKKWGIGLFKDVTHTTDGIVFFFLLPARFDSAIHTLGWHTDHDLLKFVLDEVIRVIVIDESFKVNRANVGIARLLGIIGDNFSVLGAVPAAIEAYEKALELSKIERIYLKNGLPVPSKVYTAIDNKLTRERSRRGVFSAAASTTLDDLRAMHFPRLSAEFWKMFDSHLKFTIHEGGEHAGADEEELTINSFADRVKLMNSQLMNFVDTAVREKKTIPASLIHQIAGFISGKYDGKDVKWFDIDGKQHEEGYGQTNWEECIRDHGNPFSNPDFQKVIVKFFRPSIRFKKVGRRSSVSGVRKFLEEKYPDDVEVVADTASLDFYTNVTLFNDSVKRILGGREDKTAKMKVSIEEINGSAVITFTEHKSETPVIDYDIRIKSRLAGDMGEVAKNCCGYCDLVIETDSHRYNILRSVDNPPAEVEENLTPSGNHYIKFTFTFYK